MDKKIKHTHLFACPTCRASKVIDGCCYCGTIGRQGPGDGDCVCGASQILSPQCCESQMVFKGHLVDGILMWDADGNLVRKD